MELPPHSSREDIFLAPSSSSTPALRAMVLDDDPLILDLMKRILEMKGFKVETYHDPTETFLYQNTLCPCAQRGRCPDFILSDINMPNMNGIDFMKSLFKMGCHCRHLALISGEEISQSENAEITQLGIRHFIKPLPIIAFQAWVYDIRMDILSVKKPGITPPSPAEAEITKITLRAS